MKKKVLSVFVALSFVMSIGITTVFAEPLKIRFSSGAPENHFLTRQYIEWAKLIEKKSQGDIKVEVYHSAQLYKDNEVIKAVQTGGVDSGCAFTMYLENQLVPALKVYMMPYLFQNVDETLKVYQSEVGADWKNTADKKGVKFLAMVAMASPDDQIIMTAKKPVRVPDDIKGMVIRGASPEHALAIKKWGAGPSFLSGAEVYQGLQRNIISGAANSIATYVDRKLYEAAPYAVMTPLSVVHTFIVMNKGFFDKLSQERQKAILDASAEIESNTVQVAKSNLTHSIERAKEKGKIYIPTAAEALLWKNGMSDLWEEIASGKKDVQDALKTTRTILNR
jgi:C4-dicarboxylate-binding protein DctP